MRGATEELVLGYDDANRPLMTSPGLEVAGMGTSRKGCAVVWRKAPGEIGQPTFQKQVTGDYNLTVDVMKRGRERNENPMRKQSSTIYQLKITLAHSKPPIWRRVLVPASITLDTLHDVIQSAMGWGNCHLHAFKIGGVEYSSPMEYSFPMAGGDMDGFEDERRVHLGKALPREANKIKYEYDFGDSWEHIVLLEKKLPRDDGATYPRCLAGKRACPPEDVGGVWGYTESLKALTDPEYEPHEEDEDYEEFMEWRERGIDSERFILEEVNARLSMLTL